MISTELWFSESESDNEESFEKNFVEIARKRREIRDASNPLELKEKIFLQYFRVSKEAFASMLAEIEPHLKQQIRVTSVPNVLKLATALTFCAHGCYQVSVEDAFCVGLAQSTVSLVLAEVFSVLEKTLCPKWINFTYTEEDKSRAKRYFFEKSGIPGVIGCVDGTHIKIRAPKKEQQQLYNNRKGFSSLNAMIVCDEAMRIKYIDARQPGSTRDSDVFNMSDVKTTLEEWLSNGETNTWLLGDADYPLKQYLITPYRDAYRASLESLFNEKHAMARNIIHRTIGVLKSRFRCLLPTRRLHYTPSKATTIINICAALHNVCIANNIPLLEDDLLQEIIDEQTNSTSNSGEIDDDELSECEDAVLIRKNIVQSMNNIKTECTN